MQNINQRAARKRIERRKVASKSPASEAPSDWGEKATRALKFTGAAYFVLGVVVGLAVDALSIPKSIVEFKSYVGEARGYVAGLVYRPEIWTGKFDTFPEGIVDMNDTKIWSGVGAALEIEVVENNRIDGRIWWANSCDSGSPYQGLLIDGRIKMGGSSADVEVFDFINGHRVNFFEGHLKNDGTLVHFSDFPVASGLNGSNIHGTRLTWIRRGERVFAGMPWPTYRAPGRGDG